MTPSAPRWPSAGQLQKAPRCPPCTCSICPRNHGLCPESGTPVDVPMTHGPAEMSVDLGNSKLY